MLTLTIKKVIQETPDTRTYVFETNDHSPFIYKAGQFITISILRHGKELRRSYSLSSAPGYDAYNAFTVKRIPNGEVSRYLFRYIETGSTLNAIEPSGRFIFEQDNQQSRDIFFIAAGSGITPVYSLLKHVLSTTTASAVKLIAQNRNEHAVIFHDALQTLENKYQDNFTIYQYLSNPVDPGKLPRRLNSEILARLIIDEMIFERNAALFYICGPLAFMRMAEFTIRQMGFISTQVKKEIFEIPNLPPPPFLIDPDPRNIFLTTQANKYVIPVRFPQSILDAALEQNVNIPYSCKAGICGSCVVKCITGKVKMKYNDVLTDQEVNDGLILTCVGYAATDISIEL